MAEVPVQAGPGGHAFRVAFRIGPPATLDLDLAEGHAPVDADAVLTELGETGPLSQGFKRVGRHSQYAI